MRTGLYWSNVPQGGAGSRFWKSGSVLFRCRRTDKEFYPAYGGSRPCDSGRRYGILWWNGSGYSQGKFLWDCFCAEVSGYFSCECTWSGNDAGGSTERNDGICTGKQDLRSHFKSDIRYALSKTEADAGTDFTEDEPQWDQNCGVFAEGRSIRAWEQAFGAGDTAGITGIEITDATGRRDCKRDVGSGRNQRDCRKSRRTEMAAGRSEVAAEGCLFSKIILFCW